MFIKFDRHNKYWFICNLCNNEFDRCLSSLDNQYNNVCSICRYKTEFTLFETLKIEYPNIVMQFKQEWCKKINYLPFDLCIQEYKIKEKTLLKFLFVFFLSFKRVEKYFFKENEKF